MNKTKRTIILSGLAFAFLSVIIALVFHFKGSAGRTTFSNGISYQFINDEPGDTAKNGEVVLVHYAVITPSDSVLMDTRQMSTDPIPRMVNAPQYYGDLAIVYPKLSKGDSVCITVPMDSLQFSDQKPGWFKSGDALHINLKCFDITTVDAFEKQMAVKDSLNNIEQGKEIETYLAGNKLSATKTKSGVFVVTQKEGTGAAITVGKKVLLNYTGTLMDGTKFDSSLDPGRQPMQYTFGIQQMIPGFTEAIGTMKQGTKAKFFIPSSLAYGPQAQGPIPANSILVFDVEILSVK